MDHIQKVVFNEIDGLAFCFRLTKDIVEDHKIVKGTVYGAEAYSVHVGPGEDDYDVVFNLIDEEGEVTDNFSNALTLLSLSHDTETIVLSSTFMTVEQFGILSTHIVPELVDYCKLMAEDQEIPNEAEFHDEVRDL
jgi:hypothetical protein